MPKINRRISLFAVLMLVVPAVLATAAAEIYIRVTREFETPETLRADAPAYVPSAFSRHVFPREARTIVYRRETDTKHIPINSLGYRGAKFSPSKLAGRIRIMIYGGSAVFDPEATEDRDWPHRVEQMLNEDGFSEVEVINAGILGHSSSDSFGRLFAEGHLFEPDYVVWYHGWNDIKDFSSDEPLLRLRKTYVEGKDPRLYYRNFVDRGLCRVSQLYVRLRNRYYKFKLRVGGEGAVPEGSLGNEISEVALKQFRLNVEVFVDTARNVGAIPVLMTQARLAVPDSPEEHRQRIAYSYVGLTHEGVIAAYDAIDRIVMSVAERKGVAVFDAAPTLSGRDTILYDHVHLTDQGSEELARFTANELASLLASPE